MSVVKKYPANRLANETSPYLLQHSYNPVNWYAWGEEALNEAAKQDKPIFLSIGYAACHWCHVMEKESFEDDETAKIINENFIAIKVDREERPDVDDIYMTAVQLMTGHGGWPLTVFLMPNLKPFYGGTYFPKENKQYGQQIMSGFKTILKAVSHSWSEQRGDIEINAERLTSAINDWNKRIDFEGESAYGNDIVLAAGSQLLDRFDKQWGGFGGAPKFPQVLCLFLCLRLASKLKNANDQYYESFSKAINITLNNMAMGGIYDHLGGGFCRYATDAKWMVPHFEKMLYDNALLAQIYFEAGNLFGNDNWLKIGSQTLDFMQRELSAEKTGFYSSLDADSEGEEGKFYLWSKSEIADILGPDSDSFCEMFSVTDEGNFEPDKNILHTKLVLPDANSLKEKLYARRVLRVHPGLDKKILTAWNGLAISAFVAGYKSLGQKLYLEKAKEVASFILSNLYSEGRLKHVYAAGQSKLPAYLDDYAFFVQALIDLAGVDSNPLWLKTAADFQELILKHFYSEEDSDFFFTADDQEKLIARPKNHNDGPVPSATSITAVNLIKLSVITGNQKYNQIAQLVLAKYKKAIFNLPIQYASMITAWDFNTSQKWTLVIVITGNESLDKPILDSVYQRYLPNKLVLLINNKYCPPDKMEKKDALNSLAIFTDKAMIDERPTVYVCNEYGCQSPINDSNGLQVLLNQLLKE